MIDSDDSDDVRPEEERANAYDDFGDLILSLDYVSPEIIYSSQWAWTVGSLDDMYEHYVQMFHKYPSSRSAVLDAIGTLIHKDFFLSNEGPRHVHMERQFGLHVITTRLLGVVDEYVDAKVGLVEIVQWASKIILDMIHHNRIKLSKQSRESFLRKSEIASRVLDMLSKSIRLSLDEDGYVAYKVMLWLYAELAIDEAQFEWFFAFMTKDFTVSAVKKLIRFGGNVLRRSVQAYGGLPDGMGNIETNFMQEYYFLPRFFEYVSKSCEIETTMAISKLFDDYQDGRLTDNFEIIFLIISLNFRLGLITFILNIILPSLTRQRILKLLQVVTDGSFRLCTVLLKRPEEQNFMDFVYQTLRIYKPQKIGVLLELLQPIAFDQTVLENTSEFDPNQQTALRNGLKQVCNELLNGFLRAIQGAEKIELLDLEPYSELEKDSKILRSYLQSCVPVSDFNKERLKVLHGICYWSSSSFVSKVFAMMLLSIHTLEELKQFVVFASTVIVQYRYAMLDAFKDIMRKKDYYEEVFEKEKMGFNIVRNFALLLRWSELSTKDSYMSLFSLKADVFMPQGSIMELSGSLLKFASGMLMRHLEDLEEFGQDAFKKVVAAVDLFKAIDGVSPIEPGASHSICRVLAAVYVHCLRMVRTDENDLAAMSVFKMNEAIRHLLTQKKFEFPKEAWATILIREVLLSSKEIFGFGVDLTAAGDSFLEKKIDPSLYPPSYKLFEPEFSLLLDYQTKPAFGLDQVRTLAQTGSLAKRNRERLQKPEYKSPELLRKNIFIYTVDCLLTTPSANPNAPDVSYDGSTLKEVAFTLVDVICGSKDLTSFNTWVEWSDEKYLTKEFVTINNNVESTYPAFDLMEILVAGPSPTFYCIAPIFKAMLGYLINYCDVSPVKDAKVPLRILDKIEKLFSLLILARIEKEAVLVCFDVLVRCSIHEAGAILIRIWKLLTIVKPNDDKLAEMMIALDINQAVNGTSYVPNDNRDKLLVTLLNTVQRNLKTMADLGPRIINLMSPEDSEDVWVNDLYPVGSVVGDIKRQ